jgi:hypothetical protein
MEYDIDENSGNTVEDMTVEHDCHHNIEELPELFDEESVDDFIASLNDWD